MGEQNRASFEHSESRIGTSSSDNRGSDNLQQFRLSDNRSDYLSGASSASGKDGLPQLYIDSAKGAEGLGSRPLDTVKEEAKSGLVSEQVKQEIGAGAEGKVDPIRQQIKLENEPGAAKVDPIKEQMMKDIQLGMKPEFDADRFQSKIDNLPGAAGKDHSIRSDAGASAGRRRW